MRNVIMCGGSVSDYYGDSISRTYGELVAENLECNYIHYAHNSAGNDKAYKDVVNAVMKDEIVAGDLVLFQAGDYYRKEVPAPTLDFSPGYPRKRETPVGDYNFHTWRPGDNHDDFLEPLEHAIVDPSIQLYYNLEKVAAFNDTYLLHDWIVKSQMFQGYLQSQGILLLPIVHRCIDMLSDDILQQFFTERNYNNIFWERKIWETESGKLFDLEDKYVLGLDTVGGQQPEEFDRDHYSQLGHEVVAMSLTEFYKERYLEN